MSTGKSRSNSLFLGALSKDPLCARPLGTAPQDTDSHRCHCVPSLVLLPNVRADFLHTYDVPHLWSGAHLRYVIRGSTSAPRGQRWGRCSLCAPDTVRSFLRFLHLPRLTRAQF